MTERSSVKLARTATLIMILLAAIFLIYGADPSFDNYYSFGDDGDPVAINETTFPDETFRNDVSEEFDTDNDGQLSADEISEVTEINVSYEDIETLKGIEYFTAITYLDCSENDLTQLDVSKNTSLKELNCNNNKLTALDVSKNTVLEILNCSSNKLTALDVSENTSITDLNCSNNKLMALDVSENTSITDFNCSYNKLSQLDVSKNTALEVLDCSNNKLTHLDASSNTELYSFDCSNNICAITVDDQGQFDLAELDGFDVDKASNWSGGTVSGNTLTPDENAKVVTYKYDCGNDQSATFTLLLSSDPVAINETTFPDENFRTYVSENFDEDNDGQLSAAEIARVTEIYVDSESIETLQGIEVFTVLTNLECSSNELTQLDVSKNTSLTNLDCSSNNLTQLDVSKNISLTNLDCRSNDLTQLDVSKNISLTQLYCSENNLTQLNVSKNTILESLFCSDNKLTYLDVSKNTELIDLECYRNTNAITVNEQGQFDLAELDGFDVSKASNWSGGTVDGTILTPSADKVTYDYDCGNGKSATFTLTTKSLLPSYVTLSEESFVYDGEKKAPTVEVKKGDTTLTEGTDYSMEIDEATDAGTYDVIVTGTGDYSGKVIKTFEITQAEPTLTFKDTAVEKSSDAGRFTNRLTTATDGKITYRSSNEKVAVVSSDGTVTVKGAGTATIAAEAAAGKNYKAGSASYTLTVTQAATKNTITAKNFNKVAATKAQSFSLGASAKGGAKLTYASNKSAVKVSSAGKVTIAKNFVGKATITITSAATKYYSKTTRKITITVVPKATSLTSVTNVKTKAFKAVWKKNANATGYQLQYGTSSAFKSAKTAAITSYKTTSKKIAKLTKNKKYYVRIRTYKTVSGTKYYSAWSGKKAVTIKK